MLILSGSVVDVEHRQVTPANGAAFEVVEVFVLDGREVARCTLGREWDAPIPAKGSRLEASVAVTTYKTKDGGVARQFVLLRDASVS